MLAALLAVTGCKKAASNCVPTTCAALGANCGQTTDGCGNTLDCGPIVCADSTQTCGAGGPNVCGVGACVPATCVSKLVDCGLMGDDCGNLVDCGTTCDGVATDPDGGGGGVSVGTGGAGAGTGGAGNGTGGTVGGTGGGEAVDVRPLGEGVFQGEGTNIGAADPRYAEGSVQRDSQFYFFITNGWGPGYSSSTVTWEGTSFTVSMSGSVGGNYEPVGFPTVFCGTYADKSGTTLCGLPAAVSSLTSMDTAWRWAANGNSGQYNAAYDIWMGDGTNLQSYLMVWLREPPGQQPAGSFRKSVSNVAGLTGNWDIWAGTVFGRPIINYVKAEGQDVSEVRFDVLQLIADARSQGVGDLPGTHVNGVAVGFEVWNSVTNVESIDFYVNPK